MGRAVMTRAEVAAIRRLKARGLRLHQRAVERVIAKRFLSRALRRAAGDRRVLGGDVLRAQQRALWFVVVAASHVSGRFES